MLLFLFFVMAGLGAVVKCDLFSNPNFIVEVPEENSKDIFKKQFNVYWNVPTMQCKSKRIPFHNLFEKYGIIQNEKDSFRGDKISILYDPGLFPALLKNETSGELKFRNGGVPQEGDLEKHIEVFKAVLNQSIPDPNFNGVGIIDFESWRPIFRQNFGVLLLYKDVSYDIERKRHWWWPSEMVKAEAVSRFEKAAQTFMQTTLSIAKQMRPEALWGYYGFPYCFNGGVSTCAPETRQENDRSYWMLGSSALYPSVYSKMSLNTKQLQEMIKGRVQEAARVKKTDSVILPYFWFRYRDGGFFSEKDLKAALKTFYATETSGFIIWGSSNDVNSVEKCQKLLNYVEQTFGPEIAKYTKRNSKVELDEVITEVNEAPYFSTNEPNTNEQSVENRISSITTTTAQHEDNATTSNPEMYSESSVNYTQGIIKYVEEEFVKKSGLNVTFDERDEEKIREVVEEKNPDIFVEDMLISAKKHSVDSDINVGKDLAKTKVNDFENAITKEKAYESKMNDSQLIQLLRNNAQIELLRGSDIYTTTEVSNTDIEEITNENDKETELDEVIIATTNSPTSTQSTYETTTDSVTITTDIIELNEYFEVINETSADEDLSETSTVTYETSTNYNEYTTVTDDTFSIITDNYDINNFNVENDSTIYKSNIENNNGHDSNKIKENDNIASIAATTDHYESNYFNEENRKEYHQKNTDRVTKNQGDTFNATTDNYEFIDSIHSMNEDKNEKKEKSNPNSKRDIKNGYETTKLYEDYTYNDVKEAEMTTENGSSGETTTHYGRRKHLFCILFYFYSISKCLCEMYNEC